MRIELVGFGAERHHNMEGSAFTDKKLKSPKIKVGGKVFKVNTCNRCGVTVSGKRRYCIKCAKIQRNEAQKRWRQRK